MQNVETEGVSIEFIGALNYRFHVEDTPAIDLRFKWRQGANGELMVELSIYRGMLQTSII